MQNDYGAAVFRICAAEGETWNVFQDASSQPLATFPDKNAALTYAMLLARGKVSWQTLLDGSAEIASDNAIVKSVRHG